MSFIGIIESELHQTPGAWGWWITQSTTEHSFVVHFQRGVDVTIGESELKDTIDPRRLIRERVAIALEAHERRFDGKSKAYELAQRFLLANYKPLGMPIWTLFQFPGCVEVRWDKGPTLRIDRAKVIDAHDPAAFVALEIVGAFDEWKRKKLTCTDVVYGIKPAAADLTTDQHVTVTGFTLTTGDGTTHETLTAPSTPTYTCIVEGWNVKLPPADPLNVIIDGRALRQLLLVDEECRRELAPKWEQSLRRSFTPRQRTAISNWHSQQLRTLVAAAKEKERTRVVVDVQEVDE